MTLRQRIRRRSERHLDLILEKARRGPFGAFVREANRCYPHIYGGHSSRVIVSPNAIVNDALFNVASGSIMVEGHAFFGHGVALLTGTHDIQQVGASRQHSVPRHGYDIIVEDGAWIASNATILGPCRVGCNAVVAAGSLVTLEEVPSYSVVAGVPARIITPVLTTLGQ